MKKRIISEKFLCEIWEKYNINDTMQTEDGKSITILSRGDKNNELDGPDYRNVKIKIDNKTLIGDIEIDTEISNWEKHNHHTNKKFNNIILHVTYENKSKQCFVTTENKRIIPSISLSNYITSKELQFYLSDSNSNKLYKIPCHDLNNEISEKVKTDYLISLGSKRFSFKKRKLFTRLREIAYLHQRELKEPIVNYDLESELRRLKFNRDDFNDPIIWEQLLYENIFTALGYSKNKENMNKLAKSVDIKLLRNLENNTNLNKPLEAILFKISGLLPDVNNLPDEETSVYTRELFEIWSKYTDLDYGQRLHPATWNFFRIRPQNFPTLRIAGGVKILNKILTENLIHNLIKLFEIGKDIKKLRKKLREIFVVKAEGYWQEHFVFDQHSKTKLMYLVGISRADEIIVNIILPFLSLYFEIFSKKLSYKNVLKFYLNFEQIGSNKIVDKMNSSLKIKSKKSVIYQGSLHLYLNNCCKNKCNSCEIGKLVF